MQHMRKEHQKACQQASRPDILKKSPSGRRIGSFHLSGIVKAGKRTPYSVGGEEIIVSSETWIIGRLEIGAVVRVQGVVIEKVGKIASKITVLKS